MDIGFVGLGHMGEPIAGHLLAAGHRVVVWNRTPQKAHQLLQAGAFLAESVGEATASEVLFSMLATDQAIDEVLLQSGAFDHARDGIVHVNLSTISVPCALKLAAFHRQRSQKYLSAPVFGRPSAARAGQLGVAAAGDVDALPRVQELFDAFAEKTWTLGEHAEKANVVKLANNFMLAAAIESMSEASALVSGYGISAAQLFDISNALSFSCPAYRIYGKAIAEEAFEPAEFAVSLGAKDIRLSLAAAEAVHVPMPMGSVVRDSLLEAMAMGDDDKDWAVLARVARARAGQR